MAGQKVTNLICLVAIALTTTVKLTSAVTCYNCNFCNVVDNKTETTNCSTSCKTYSVAVFDRNITWRGCSDNVYNESAPCDMKFIFANYENVQRCLCNTNLCNSMFYSAGPAIKFSFILAVFGLLGAFVLKVV
ncbi:hypothetical protein HELRODRAFT_173365 [Helobdella robusta]|uniref:Protein quiver n=1 Tax=Helobdella robusta TaxID=6412 RepID=T1F6Q4_HELRO|nr:hypothetical protein HELRODRAFT_173365 [Helobdella robusta]ESO03667.1 hypothetical protein HELRODRAFT_173365 [Helobdella robusta]